VLDRILKPRAEKQLPTLLWMPTSGSDGVFSGSPSKKICEAAEVGYKYSAAMANRRGQCLCPDIQLCRGMHPIRREMPCRAGAVGPRQSVRAIDSAIVNGGPFEWILTPSWGTGVGTAALACVTPARCAASAGLPSALCGRRRESPSSRISSRRGCRRSGPPW
jgi:hypothetical protein